MNIVFMIHRFRTTLTQFRFIQIIGPKLNLYQFPIRQIKMLTFFLLRIKIVLSIVTQNKKNKTKIILNNEE